MPGLVPGTHVVRHTSPFWADPDVGDWDKPHRR